MSAVPDAVAERMRQVLEGIVERFSGQTDMKAVVQEHAWYDEAYVGRFDDKIAAWRGFSANLRPYGNYRTIYLDYVVNPFSFEENSRLFGENFATVIAKLDDYVCLYVTACTLKCISSIDETEFTYKRFARNIHPSQVTGIPDFLSQPNSRQIESGVQLVLFQSAHC